MKKRLLSALLVLTMVLSMVPFGALAEDVTEPVETTVATETTEATETTAAAETTEPTVPETTAPSEPTAVEKVQALINALPETVTAENRAEVEAQLTAIDEAKLPLSDEERNTLNFGKYNAAIATINTMDDMAGAEVPETLFDLQYITAVGNGDGNWLNGEKWAVDSVDNRMTEVYSGVWEITYRDIEEFDNYQVKFACNGSWQPYNWTIDGILDGQDNPSCEVSEDGSTVTLRIDVSEFNFETGTGSVKTEFIVTAPGVAPTVGYTITFDPNGGTLPEGTSTTATTDANGKLATLPTPTKSNNAFLGWYNGETKWGTDSVATENITLTAKWSDGSNVTSEEELLACLNGGIRNIKMGADINLTNTLDISRSVKLDLNGHVLKMTGSENGIVIEVASGGYLRLSDSNSTATHTDTTLPNGGVIAGGVVNVKSGSLLSLDNEVNADVDGNGGIVTGFHIKKGCILNWHDGSLLDPTIEDGGTLNCNSGTVVQPSVQCGGTLNCNGGEVIGAWTNRGTISHSDGVTTASKLEGSFLNNTTGIIQWGNYSSGPMPNYGVISGGTFSCYTENRSGGIISGGTFTDYVKNMDGGIISGGDFSEARELTGVYTVTFDLNGASGTAPAKQWRANASATKPTDPVASDGYAFIGWYDGDTQWDFDQEVTQDMTLTAKFEAIVTTEAELKAALADGFTDIQLKSDITLTEDLVITQQDWNLDLNGHTLSGSQIKFSTGKMTVADSVGGGSVNNSITLTNATLSGTVFQGFVNCVMSTIDGGAFYGQVNLITDSDVKNGLFYAQNAFGTATTTGKQVVFQLNGSFLYMQATTGTATEPEVAKNGYTFTGWCQDAGCKGDKWDFTKPVSENMTLYATKTIKTYTITYNPGADDATGTIENGTKEYGKDFTLNMATYSRKGYVQVGWKGSDGKTYTGGAVYQANADLTLTAIWEEVNSFTVPFTKTVKQSGSTKPGKATFSLYICGIEKLPNVSGDIDCTGRVDIKGTGDFTGELTISGSRELVWAMLENGIYIREWDSEMDNWTYDDSVYFLRLNQYDDGYQLDVYDATAKTVGQSMVFSHGNKTVKMTFTNTYGTTTTTADSSNPKTGDNISVAVATLILSTMALVAILPRKKRI